MVRLSPFHYRTKLFMLAQKRQSANIHQQNQYSTSVRDIIYFIHTSVRYVRFCNGWFFSVTRYHWTVWDIIRKEDHDRKWLCRGVWCVTGDLMSLVFCCVTIVPLVNDMEQLTNMINPCPGNGGVFLPPSAVFAENRLLNNGLRQLVFVTLSQILLAFWRHEVYHYIYFRFYVAVLHLTSTRLVFRHVQMKPP